jgi:coenzyme F420-reducing hydrogenase beta subunit
MEHVVKALLENRDKKFAIVGTPCQLQGLTYAIKKYRLDRNKIILLGLFCDKTLNYNFYDYFKDCIDGGKSIKLLEYRTKEYGGWPGNTKVVFDDGESIAVDKMLRMKVKEVFQLKRCRYCIDKLNQFSDISFGDCYIKDQDDLEGKSSIIIRTKLGEEVLDSCLNKISIEKVKVKSILESQKLHEKVVNLARAEKLNEGLYIGLTDIGQLSTSLKSEFKFKLVNYLGKNYDKKPKRYRKLIEKYVVKQNTIKYIEKER